MSDVTENLLQSRWAEYQRLFEVSASLVRLAEMDNVLSQEGTTRSISCKWVLFVQEETIPDEMYRRALAEADLNVSRLKRMLSVGTNFTHEEMVLAITLRVELQLLAELLLKRRGEIEFASDLADDDLRAVFGHPQNVAAFRAAKGQQRETGVLRSGRPGLNKRINQPIVPAPLREFRRRCGVGIHVICCALIAPEKLSPSYDRYSRTANSSRL